MLFDTSTLNKPGFLGIGATAYVWQFDGSYTLLQDTQDCIAAFESCGIDAGQFMGGYCFALLGEGEYLELWDGDGFIPLQHDVCTRVA